MNPMDQLRAARPAHLDTPVDEGTRAAELSYAMARARTVRARTIAKPVWGGLALAGAATVTAVAVAVSGTGGTTPRAPSRAEAAPAATSAAPVVRLSAKQILLAAADSSLRAPAATGAYWYVDSVIGVANEAGTRARYLVHSTTSHRLWIARSPEGESWFVDRNLGTRPAKGAEDAWARDGSPTKWSVEVPEPKADDKNALGRMELDSTPGRPFGNPINIGDKVFELAGKNVSVADLQALPTTAAALKQRLLQGYAGHGTESDDPQDADSWLYQVTSGLLRDMPVKPAVRAAAYKVLAGLDGVRSLGEVTDTLGRTGQGIARPENWSGGGFERQLVIDPETGILLTDQIVAVRPTGGYAWAEPGTPIWWEATTEASWTDKAPEKP
ncbi:CU044_5270 family protein [Sphaerisporangium viridialbum]|uniref:CU044_5270 family protein n=1 Tax=Sphaerisporangium viridialbum TaxID=46189 RepID=UPI003C761973